MPRAIIAALALSASLAACGQKGPLYLAPEQIAQPVAGQTKAAATTTTTSVTAGSTSTTTSTSATSTKGSVSGKTPQ